MLSWIFRHCSRLCVIYRASDLPELAGERFARARKPRVRRRPLDPGELRSTRGRCELRPMPRRVEPRA